MSPKCGWEARTVQELLSQMSIHKDKSMAMAGRKGSSAMWTPPNPVLGFPSLRGSEQLGEYNHRGNATGQADKRRLRARLEWWWGLSFRQFFWLSIKTTECRGPTGAPDCWFPDGEV